MVTDIASRFESAAPAQSAPAPQQLPGTDARPTHISAATRTAPTQAAVAVSAAPAEKPAPTRNEGATGVPAWKLRLEKQKALEEEQRANAAEAQMIEDDRRAKEVERKRAAQLVADEEHRREAEAAAAKEATRSKFQTQEMKAEAGLGEYLQRAREKRTLASPIAASTPQSAMPTAAPIRSSTGSATGVPAMVATQAEIESEEFEEDSMSIPGTEDGLSVQDPSDGSYQDEAEW
jgi:hypothetical protein